VRYIQSHTGASYDATANGFTVFGKCWNEKQTRFVGDPCVYMSDVEPVIIDAEELPDAR
jgi:hypothetical protein